MTREEYLEIMNIINDVDLCEQKTFTNISSKTPFLKMDMESILGSIRLALMRVKTRIENSAKIDFAGKDYLTREEAKQELIELFADDGIRKECLGNKSGNISVLADEFLDEMSEFRWAHLLPDSVEFILEHAELK